MLTEEAVVGTIDPSSELLAQNILAFIFGVPLCLYLVLCIYGNLTATPQPYAAGVG